MRRVGTTSRRLIDRLILGLLTSGINSNEFDRAGARDMPERVGPLFFEGVFQCETVEMRADLQ